MMHEDQFKEIIGVYKKLREEGVVFPKRDPNSQFFINFNGKKSPIFETIENNKIYEVGSEGTAKNTQSEPNLRGQTN